MGWDTPGGVGIAVIARNRRDRKVKAREPTPNWDELGMIELKSFGILVKGYRGRVGVRSDDPVIG